MASQSSSSLDAVLQQINARLAALESVPQRLAAIEAVVGQGGGSAAAVGGGATGDSEGPPASVAAFDARVMSKVGELVQAADKLDEPAKQLTGLVLQVFEEQRKVLHMASQCRKPEASKLPTIMTNLNKAAQRSSELKGELRGTEYENHATAVNEALPAAQWVVIDSLPYSIVESYRDGAQFWLNRVRVAHKGKDDGHTAWCNAMVAAYNALFDFVKEHFKTGLTWNPKGKDVSEFAGEATAAAAPKATTPATTSTTAASSGDKGGEADAGGLTMDNVFSQLRSIDQSSGRTAGLRRVTKEMKTARDKPIPQPRAKPASASTGGAVAKKSAEQKPSKPPRIELVGKRWFVENHEGGDPIVLDNIKLLQEVYVANCRNATIILKGKCKVMQLERCHRSKLLFDSAISSCEIVDCTRCQVQVNDNVPSIAVDKTDGLLIYLAHSSKASQVVTSKSSEVNISFPKSADQDAEWVELPVPEQFVSKLTPEDKVHTTVSELYA